MHLDGCAFGLRNPDSGIPVQRRLHIFSSSSFMAQRLGRRCDGRLQHAAPRAGGPADEYTSRLADRVADLVMKPGDGLNVVGLLQMDPLAWSLPVTEGVPLPRGQDPAAAPAGQARGPDRKSVLWPGCIRTSATPPLRRWYAFFGDMVLEMTSSRPPSSTAARPATRARYPAPIR